MSPPPTIIAEPTPSTDREEMRSAVQRRLELFSRLAVVVFCVLVGFIVTLGRLYPVQRPQEARIVITYGVAGALVCAFAWYQTLHRRRATLEELYRLDALYTVVIGGALGVTAYFYTARFAAIYSSLVIALFTRTILVPSSGLRTLVVGSLAFASLFVAGVMAGLVHPHRIDMPLPPFLFSVALFSGLAVALAAAGSQVIYGLRRSISRAMQLGQYTLEGKLGEGGMGVVHKARHAMLRRPTAIKLLHPTRHDAGALARFEREVQLMSQLTHPNTVAVYDYGRSPDGIFYYVMEYLDGIDLERLVRRHGPQPAARVIHVIEQLCGALDEAHAMGLIHRDVKPANILLCRRGGTADVAKLVDFGLAQQVAGGAGAARGIVGTPAFISPEAVTEPERVGPASDLYALGATAYFLLTGHHVFEGKTPLEVCTQHATARPVAPSRRTTAHVPAALEALVLALLAKDPAKRPASARSVAAALRAMAEREEWSDAEARMWWRRFDSLRDTALELEAAAPPTTLTVDLSRHDAPEAVAA
jgi:predicted Ser/Thr protein kinase